MLELLYVIIILLFLLFNRNYLILKLNNEILKQQDNINLIVWIAITESNSCNIRLN